MDLGISGGLFGVAELTCYNILCTIILFVLFLGMSKIDIGFGSGISVGIGGVMVLVFGIFLEKELS